MTFTSPGPSGKQRTALESQFGDAAFRKTIPEMSGYSVATDDTAVDEVVAAAAAAAASTIDVDTSVAANPAADPTAGTADDATATGNDVSVAADNATTTVNDVSVTADSDAAAASARQTAEPQHVPGSGDLQEQQQEEQNRDEDRQQTTDVPVAVDAPIPMSISMPDAPKRSSAHAHSTDSQRKKVRQSGTEPRSRSRSRSQSVPRSTPRSAPLSDATPHQSNTKLGNSSGLQKDLDPRDDPDALSTNSYKFHDPLRSNPAYMRQLWNHRGQIYTPSEIGVSVGGIEAYWTAPWLRGDYICHVDSQRSSGGVDELYHWTERKKRPDEEDREGDGDGKHDEHENEHGEERPHDDVNAGYKEEGNPEGNPEGTLMAEQHGERAVVVPPQSSAHESAASVSSSSSSSSSSSFNSISTDIQSLLPPNTRGRAPSANHMSLSARSTATSSSSGALSSSSTSGSSEGSSSGSEAASVSAQQADRRRDSSRPLTRFVMPPVETCEHWILSPEDLDQDGDLDGDFDGDLFDFDIEEGTKAYRPGGFHPVRIGEVYNQRYLVLRKLGYGAFSTVWLVEDLTWERERERERQRSDAETESKTAAVKDSKKSAAADLESAARRKYVAMKVLSAECYYTGRDLAEREILHRLREANPRHAGYDSVCHLVDDFEHAGPFGTHVCLVFELMGETLDSFGRWFDDEQIPNLIMRSISAQLLSALKYAHDTGIIHTDIKGDNIFVKVRDFSLIEESYFRDNPAEMILPAEPYHPLRSCPLRNHYSRGDTGMFSCAFALGDWGVATWADRHLTEVIQPRGLRAPEVILRAPWSYPADIWNVGVIVLELSRNARMFNPYDRDGRRSNPHHLHQMTSFFGPVPESLMARGRAHLVRRWLRPDGVPWELSADQPFARVDPLNSDMWMGDPVGPDNPAGLSQPDRDLFCDFLHFALRLDPNERPTIAELMAHPWLGFLKSGKGQTAASAAAATTATEVPSTGSTKDLTQFDF